MTEKKSITRAQAIEYALNGVEYARKLWETDGDWSPEQSEEVIAVLTKMHGQLTKPRAKAVTKARKANENLAERVCECFPIDGSAVTTKDVVNMGFPEITTTQKAAAVLRVACELGLASKVVDGKKVSYKAVTTE